MTVSVSERLSPLYEGNGINTRFDFTFRVFDQEDASGVSVKHQVGADFENVDESLYTVTINEDNLGGFVTFYTAPEVGFQFYLAGETPVDQQLDITNYDNFYPDAIERSLDKLTAILQEWAHSLGLEKISREKALEILDLAIQDQIRQQGLAMDQIDSYAKDLAENIKNIVIERGWLAELIVDGDQNQKEINDAQKLKNSQIVNLDDFKKSTNTDTDAIGLMFEYVKAHPEVKEMNITRDITVSERILMQQDASKWLNGKVLNAENINIHYTGNGADSLYVAILQVTGALTTVTTTATVDYPEYTSDLTVADASIFAVGDYILIRSTSLAKPDIYLNHMVRIEGIAGNVLKTDTVRRLAVRPSIATVNVTKVNNVDGFKLKGRPTFTAVNQTARSNGIGGVILTQCTNSYAEAQSKGLWFKTLVLNNCHRSDGIALNSDAVAKGGGEGYALQLLYSVYCTGRDCFGNNLRHTTDATASWHCTFENNRDVGASSGSFIHHAAYEYNIKYFNCHSVNSQTNGFAFGTVTGAFGDTSSEIEVNNCTTENSALDCIVFANKGKGLKIIGGSHGSTGNGYSVNTSNNDTSVTESTLRTGLLISTSADMATDGFTELNNSKVRSGSNTRALNITANRQLKINGGEVLGRWTLDSGVIIRDVGADIITPDASSLITLLFGINNQHWYKDGGRLILNATVSVSQVYQASIIDFNDVTLVQNNPNIVQSFNGTTVRLKNNKGAARVAFNGNTVTSLDLFGNTLSGLSTFNLFTLTNFTQEVRVKSNTLTTSGAGNTVNVDNTNTIPMLHLNGNSLIGNINIPDAQVSKCIATTNTIKGIVVLPTNDNVNKIVSNNISY